MASPTNNVAALLHSLLPVLPARTDLLEVAPARTDPVTVSVHIAREAVPARTDLAVVLVRIDLEAAHPADTGLEAVLRRTRLEHRTEEAAVHTPLEVLAASVLRHP